MLEATCEYALTRHQFGRPIGEFQSVKHPLAELAMVHRFSRALIWFAARAWQRGDDGWEEWALLCKAHVTEQVCALTRQCVFLMGAYGFAWESGEHVWLKRALFNFSYLGGATELRRRLAALRGWA